MVRPAGVPRALYSSFRNTYYRCHLHPRFPPVVTMFCTALHYDLPSIQDQRGQESWLAAMLVPNLPKGLVRNNVERPDGLWVMLD